LQANPASTGQQTYSARSTAASTLSIALPARSLFNGLTQRVKNLFVKLRQISRGWTVRLGSGTLGLPVRLLADACSLSSFPP